MDGTPFPEIDTRHRHRHPLWAPGTDLARRWLLAVLAGVAAYAAARTSTGHLASLLVGWDVTLVVSLVLPWRRILRSTPETSRLHAVRDDPGSVVLLVVSLAVSIGALLTAVLILTRPGRMGTGIWADLEPALVGISIVAGWAVLQTGFTLHYARLYYREDDTPGGLDFKGDNPPDDLDFAYFGFGVGVAFQTSDVDITSRDIRRTVLAHSVISFFYSASVLALTVNILAGKLG